MKPNFQLSALSGAILLLAGAAVHAADFDLLDGQLRGTWTTDLTLGGGYRLKNASCALVGDPTMLGCGGRADTQLWSNGDDGNLNYRRNRFYSLYGGVASELLLRSPDNGYKFMIRATGLYDGAADSTERTQLSSQARSQIVHNVRLYDLWLEKKLDLGDQSGHVRVGNQVINWGESYFLPYGINATNAIDYQKASTPGQQLKQIILPAPMLSLASSLTSTVSAEAYYQFRWNKNLFPPVGSFWSASDVFGRADGYRQLVFDNAQPNYNVGGLDPAALARLAGQDPKQAAVYQQYASQLYSNNNGAYDLASFGYPVRDIEPDKRGHQYGMRLAYRPDGMDLNLGAYYMRYTDKSPVFTFRAADATLTYLDNRDLFGLSANFPLGDWAIGGELTYRPRDAIALTGCFGPGGALDATTNPARDANGNNVDCPAYRDNKKWQLTVNAQYNMTPSTTPLVGWLNASAGYFLAEAAWIRYPGVAASDRYYSTQAGVPVMQGPAAGGLYWYDRSNPANTLTATQGTANSLGAAVYASVTYDGNLISGWQVTPSIYHQQAISGYTPSATAALWMSGVKATTLGLTFAQNPLEWQAGINFVKYWGGTTTSNPYRDRDSIGFFVTRTF
jgi:hypothetical protein